LLIVDAQSKSGAMRREEWVPAFFHSENKELISEGWVWVWLGFSRWHRQFSKNMYSTKGEEDLQAKAHSTKKTNHIQQFISGANTSEMNLMIA
jgi:hypothetical protein